MTKAVKDGDHLIGLIEIEPGCLVIGDDLRMNGIDGPVLIRTRLALAILIGALQAAADEAQLPT